MEWNNLSVLLTGGTGSFGRKFTEMVLRDHPPKKLIIFSRDELKQHEMRQTFDGPNIRYFIGDVRDKERLHRALNGVDVVIHAAALKQVPSCEYNPFETVLTNIIGAKNIIDEAIDHGVKKVIALSTDKAVNPINLYGATKLCAEKIVVQANSYSAGGTRFSCVRYGNVVGSRGSVVPLFQRQKAAGTVTITDPRMTRFWITLEQGVRFVIKCLDLMEGGEIFVPKIPATDIRQLAKAIAPKARQEITGIRPGEKLTEVLISEDEARRTKEYGDYYIIEPDFHWWGGGNHAGGRALPEGFKFNSDNADRLSDQELIRLIDHQA